MRSLVTFAVSVEVTKPTWTEPSDGLGPVDGVVLDDSGRGKFHEGSIVIVVFIFIIHFLGGCAARLAGS